MKYCLIIFCFCFSFLANAQSSEDSVKSVVNDLFTAMKNADSVSVVGVFADSAILQTITNKDGKTVVKTETVASFAGIIGGLQKDDADERIVFDALKIDGELAIVWAPYKFYYKGKLSHCGADSFQLVRINGKWKIQYLIDTRRRGSCD